MKPRARTRTFANVAILSLPLIALSWLQPAAIQAQCNGYSPVHTPAKAVPEELWNELRPADAAQLPPNRDTTDFNQFSPWLYNPYFFSLDVENGWLFAAASQRLMIWNATETPEAPVLTGDLGLDQMGLTWSFDVRAYLVFSDIDAPPGRNDLVALSGRAGVGLAVFDTTMPEQPRLIYQDHGTGTPLQRSANQVFTTTFEDVNGEEGTYAFVAASGSSGGLFAYDLDAARTAYDNSFVGCIEGQPSDTTKCPDVFLGQLGDRLHVNAVDGSGHFVVAGSVGDHGGSNAGSIVMWDVSDPSAPELLFDALPNDHIAGVALWQQGANYYLAVRALTEHRIYDVSCITDGPCDLGAPIWSQSASVAAVPNLGTVTASFSEDTPFLYWGTGNLCPTFPQEEWLHDVSNPAAPRDISPQGQVEIKGENTTYWSWYYRTGGTLGFNYVQPMAGKFHGPYFYRAARGILDVHERTMNPPDVHGISLTPNAPRACQSLVLLAENVTGEGPLSFSWEILDPQGQPVATSDANPFVWRIPSTQTAGTYTAEVTISNDLGDVTQATDFEVRSATQTRVEVTCAALANDPAQSPVSDDHAATRSSTR